MCCGTSLSRDCLIVAFHESVSVKQKILLCKPSIPGGGGTCQNFDRDARPIFLGLKFDQILFFWVGKFFSYSSGFHKISAIFLGLTNFQLFFGSSNFCIIRLNPLKEEHTVPKNIKS